MTLLTCLFQTIAITGATVHSMLPGESPAVETILMENGYVSAVGKDVVLPAGAEVIDATGMHVIPGLIDGYVNLDPDHDRLYVSAGVTLVRDTGNDLTRILAERDPNSRARSPGPTIWSSGAVIDSSPPSTRAVILLDTAADAEAKLPKLFELDGIDFLSFHKGFARDAWARTLQLAHAEHRQVWGPLAKSVSLADALAAGQDGIYHIEAFLPTGTNWDGLTQEMMQDIASRAGAKRLAVTPTLAVYAKVLVPPKDPDNQLRYLSPYYCETWAHDLNVREKLVSEEFLRLGQKKIEAQGRLLMELHKHGCRLVPGSGAPNAWLFPGTALLDELSLWRRAGIPDAELVRLATQGAASTIGADKHGTIRAGTRGDLVITKGDPTTDIGHLYRPAMVALRGKVLDRQELDQKLEDLAAVQARVKTTLASPLAVEQPEIPAGDVVLTGSVETRGVGTRVSAERYAVVRRYDGSLTYCGRVLIPGEATTFATETKIQQTIQNGDLTEFEVEIKNNSRVLNVRGALVAGKLSIERRLNGQFVSTDAVPDRFAFVDCGSVTGLIAMGYHRTPGDFKVLYFEDYEPAIGSWRMALDKDALHVVRTQNGAMRVLFDAVGGLVEAKREVGNTILQTVKLDSKAVGGKGLPMPAAKRAAVPVAPKPAVDAPRQDAPK
ncbi:MAG: hypothetical protein JNL28_15175 [Planctomycetes bacterium]|nr:hypothetical protein [Planctomycetota bacterium]